MAATIATAVGYDTSRRKETHRLGSERAHSEANTWRTFATAEVKADGSGYIEVRRDGKTLAIVAFGVEGSQNLTDVNVWGEPTIRVDGLEVEPVRKHWGEDYGKR